MYFNTLCRGYVAVSAAISAPKCEYTPALSQSEFFYAAAPLSFPKDTAGEDYRRADTVRTKQPVPPFSCQTPQGVGLRQNGCRNW